MSSIATSKDELVLAITTNYTKLVIDYNSIPVEYVRTIGVEGNVKGSHISVCDTVAYLIGWGKLVLKWCDKRSKNQAVDFPETGYKWNELGLLAQHFHEYYAQWSYCDLLQELDNTMTAILTLIENTDNDTLYHQLFYKKYSLGRMVQFNTAAPIKNMRTKVRRFKKQQGIT